MLLPLFVFCAGSLSAQPTTGDGGRYPGTTGDQVPFDTTAQRELRDRSLEAAGVFEGPIDPLEYRLGPGDQLTIGIPTVNYRQFEASVTPDAKVTISGVGEVNVRGRSLAEASSLIRAAVMRVYNVRDVTVSLSRMRRFKVHLIGNVRKPGTVTATPVTRVAEVVDLSGGVHSSASKRKITIQRGTERIEVDLLRYYTDFDLRANPFVLDGDIIKVGFQDEKSVIGVYGAVYRGGEFDFRPGDSISSAIRSTFGFTADASLDSIEVVNISARGDTIGRNFYRATPDGAILGDRPLQSGDRIFVRSIPDFGKSSDVVVAGEVRAPGVYAIIPGQTRLRELIERTGGFTGNAAISDALLVRRSAYIDDKKLALIRQIDPEKWTEEERDYVRSKATDRPGVMTVDFADLMRGSEKENLTLEDNDSIWVPSAKDFIVVGGKVKNPGNVIYRPGADFEYYIASAGGYGWKADEGETRIVKGRNADTYPASSDNDYALEPGDQIYVPEEQPSDFWEGFTQVVTIIAQIGTIVAVVLSVRASTR